MAIDQRPNSITLGGEESMRDINIHPELSGILLNQL